MLAKTNNNPAAELGPEKYQWWKDWRGECVALIASGVSAKKANIDALRDRIHVAVVKDNIELCPWADLVYGCDFSWWQHVAGLPKYDGLKLCYGNPGAHNYPGLHKIEIRKTKLDKILTDEPASIGSGGNSGFQLLNIVVQFGAVGIILIGFDMHGRSGVHWFGRNNGAGMSNPSEHNFDRWRKAFAGVAPDLAERGIDVVNASPASALECFQRDTIEGALAKWGL